MPFSHSSSFALIVELGYHALTMERLAARVGISHPTLYHHLASRGDIALRAAGGHEDEEVQHRLDEEMPGIRRGRLLPQQFAVIVA